MQNKIAIVKKSILENYIKLSQENKKPMVVDAEEDLAQKISTIKNTTGLVFPDKALNGSLFNELLPIMQVGASIEHSSSDYSTRDKQAIYNAAILAILFNNLKDVVSYLRLYEHKYIGNQLLHDACLIILPPDEQWDIELWKALIQKYYHHANFFKIFQNALAVEHYIKEHRTKLEKDKSDEIDARQTKAYVNKYDELQNQKKLETQVKATQKNFESWLKDQLGFPKNSKPTGEQKKVFEQRLKNPTTEDKLYRATLIEHHEKTLFAKYADVDFSSKELFVKTMLAKNQKQIASFKVNENQSLFSKDTSYEQLNLYLNLIKYKYYTNNVAAAELFTDLGISEKGFNEYLSLIPKDNSTHIPDVSLNGEILGYKEYQLKKLSPYDPRAAVLGKLTSCCQFLTAMGAESTRHGITNESGGFYVLFHIDPRTRKERVVAQCWAWRGRNNFMVFDSVESDLNFRKKDGAVQLITDFYAHLADKLVQEKEVPAVMVGLGGATPDTLKKIQVPSIYNDYLDNHFSPYDSKKQGFLAIRGTSLCSLFSTKKIADSQGKILPALAKNFKSRLVFTINYCGLDSKLFEFCGLTNEIVKASLKEYESILTKLEGDDAQVVQKAFLDLKQHLGFDSHYDWLVLDIGVIPFRNKERFLTIILADKNNHKLVSTMDGLDAVLSHVREDNRLNFVKNVVGKDKIQALLHSIADLNQLLYKFPRETWRNFVNEVQIEEKCHSLITSIDDLNSILVFWLDDYKITFISSALGAKKLQSLIKSIADLKSLFVLIASSKNFINFIKQMLSIENLRLLINSAEDLSQVLKSMDIDKSLYFIENVLGIVKLHSLIKSIEDVKLLLALIHPVLGHDFLKILKQQELQSWLSSAEHLQAIFNLLPERDRVSFMTTLFEKKKHSLSINSITELKLLLASLDRKGQYFLIEYASEEKKITPLIKSVADLEIVFKFFPPHVTVFYLCRILGGEEKFEELTNSLGSTLVDITRITDLQLIIDAIKRDAVASSPKMISVNSLKQDESSGSPNDSIAITPQEPLEVLSGVKSHHDISILDKKALQRDAVASSPKMISVNSLKQDESSGSPNDSIAITPQEPLEVLSGVKSHHDKSILDKKALQRDAVASSPKMISVNSLKQDESSGSSNDSIAIASQKRLEVLSGVNFDHHLFILNKKALQLKEKSKDNTNYTAAAQKADNLCIKLKEAKDTFLNDKNCDINELTKTFKNDCLVLISDAKTILEHHREWGGALARFLADIIGLVSSNLASKLGFFGKTDSYVKLELFQRDFDSGLKILV